MNEVSNLRVDKWLWSARFFKTRGLALEAIKGGKILLNGFKPKPSKTIQIGDTLKITQPHRQISIKVVEVSNRRGNAEMAQKMYDLLAEFLNQRKPTIDMALVGYREKGSGRPTKRDRRKINQLKF